MPNTDPIKQGKQASRDSSADDAKSGPALWADVSLPGVFLQAILIVAVLASIGATIYIVTSGKSGDSFTEFYILGTEGKAENYPSEIVLGEEAAVTLGIVNREHEEMSYRVQIKIDEELVKEIGPVTLSHEEKWEERLSFMPGRAGDDQKAEFILYKQEQGQPYLTLRLWINVKER